MDELEPCPCGSTDLREQSLEPTGQESDYAQIVCNDCGIRGPISDQVGNFRRPFDAWNAIWNTRTTPSVQEAAYLDGFKSAIGVAKSCKLLVASEINPAIELGENNVVYTLENALRAIDGEWNDG